TGSPIFADGVYVPTDVLDVHPGSSTDTIVAWTAPTSGDYTISGSFALLDITPHPIIGEVYEGSSQLYSQVLTGPGATSDAVGGSESFDLTEYVSAGETIYFGVNDDNDYDFQSTGLIATIESVGVPEPATWVLMLAGFAGMGAMLRARREKVNALA
ncbi:MAG TPA: PEPxxWA-CTERM sorting domain-containing protein, partial [Caulobacteraceae bacterium]